LASKIEKDDNMTKKIFLGQKIQTGIKTRRIHADFKSVEKVLKKYTQKMQSIERTS
jgi:hypothetical protein